TEAAILYTEAELEAAARLLFEGADRAFFGLLTNLRQKYCATSLPKAGGELEKTPDDLQPVGLMMDPRLQPLPFASVPRCHTRRQSYFRVPSVRFAAAQDNAYQELVKTGASDSKTGYLLNPSDNLQHTESFFKQRMQSIPEWTGVIGYEPSGPEIGRLL